MRALARHANADGTLSPFEYERRREQGEPASGTIRYRWGWRHAAEKAGLKFKGASRPSRYTTDDAIRAMHACVKAEGRITFEVYASFSTGTEHPSVMTIIGLFGTWREALRTAGF